MQKSNTKRSLTSSMIVLLVCIAMLIGTTFAWFTDSVTSGKNKIKAGNLDVDLVMDKEENGIYVSIADQEAAIFGGENSLIAQNKSNDTLWEPGKTQIVYLGVKNAGTLALKYNMMIDVKDEGLIGALEYAFIDGAKAADLSAAEKWSDIKSAPGVVVADVVAGRTKAAQNGVLDEIAKGTVDETDYFALAVHMKEDAGNEYKDQGIVIDVTVVATQKDAEKDAFGDQYDAGATFPVASNTELQEALGEAQSGDTIKLVKNAEVELPSENYKLKEGVNISGEEGTVLKVTGSNALKLNNGSSISNVKIEATNTGDKWEYNSVLDITGNNVKVENVTITSTNRDTPIKIGSIASAENEIVIKDSTIDAAFKAIHIVDGSKGKIIIENCNISAVYPFNVNTNSDPEVIVKNSTLNGWTSYSGTCKKVTFTDCNFGKGHGYAVLMAYADTELINCTFSSDFEVYTKNGCNKAITFTNCNKAGTLITSANVNTIFDDTDSDSIKNAGWTVTVN